MSSAKKRKPTSLYEPIVSKIKPKITLSTLKNVWVQNFHFLTFRSVRYAWARGHVGHVERMGT